MTAVTDCSFHLNKLVLTVVAQTGNVEPYIYNKV